ncbi:MAG: 1-(5-phosphoribosyl)-5-[(5-phosphoribosylamino)methylideneamino]imidazole-4-carboxamide isomerase [Mariniphaga sp.]|nr:1-(5-phosphoribosyl)-5-[(5-phosphoribosylamino)methylideneamino]imidazole-4-carboxamide isomerase [Mariniphaga sp.]MDD4226837.1 1-(5-phosphoribosyl)-5-[(5-phosphoribosylamino)methylideneamino]imidazole-4-carboxamide isomerase [Mariniphaga sp.]MDD4424530.1 1-(5-phosphoribosyl)-5-[(5-phosphoribosylamino)methylideneamino]imidazole-4-carboxamide isomerase [Mariniphaga sp.]
MNKKIEIIPAIDIIGGKCVRLSQGDYNRKTVYNENPLEVARMFEDAGIKRLHLVDLDGAKAKHIVHYKVLERIASGTDLIIDFGGGLKSGEDLEIAFKSGAAMVTGGSIAVREPEVFLKWLEKYGSEKIILGADAKEGKIAVSGWQENTEWPVVDFIAGFHQQGITQVISTDIGRDGMLTGPAFDLYSEIQGALPGVKIIASGGIASMDNIYKLAEMDISGVITGKAIYEGKISLNEIEKYNQ